MNVYIMALLGFPPPPPPPPYFPEMVKFLDRTTPMSMTSGGRVGFYDKIICQGIVINEHSEGKLQTLF